MLSIARLQRATTSSVVSTFQPTALLTSHAARCTAKPSTPRPPRARRPNRDANQMAQFSSSSRPTDVFHGLSLDEEPSRTSAQRDSPSISKSDPVVREAQLVQTQEDKLRTRRLVAHLVQAEILAHSPGNNSSTKSMGPYERQLLQLQRAVERHSRPSRGLEHAKSCFQVGDMYYRLGMMEESQHTLMEGLRALIHREDSQHNLNRCKCNNYSLFHRTEALLH